MFDLKKFLQDNKLTQKSILSENILLNLGYFIGPEDKIIVSDLVEKESKIEEQLKKGGYTFQKEYKYDTFSNKIVEFEVNEKALNESAVLHSRVVKEGPLSFKIMLEVPERPGKKYAYTIKSTSEETALQELEKKMEGRSYSVKSIQGSQLTEVNIDSVDKRSIQLGGVDYADYPKFTDAYVESASFTDGTPLSDEDLDQLTDKLAQSGELHDLAYQQLISHADSFQDSADGGIVELFGLSKKEKQKKTDKKKVEQAKEEILKCRVGATAFGQPGKNASQEENKRLMNTRLNLLKNDMPTVAALLPQLFEPQGFTSAVYEPQKGDKIYGYIPTKWAWIKDSDGAIRIYSGQEYLTKQLSKIGNDA